MAQVIIHPDPLPEAENKASIIYPILECGLPIEEIARKDVPAGIPYKIIDASLVPQDQTFRDAWEVDFTEPDGYGIGPDAWFAEQAAKEQP